ncbi:HAD-IA family hydrolase [Plantibacter flavus]|uniref:HAD-IA family hydrolase n=1 Tax=Plantibacter flavus TaxID=150123 RepID=UPI003F17EF19
MTHRRGLPHPSDAGAIRESTEGAIVIVVVAGPAGSGKTTLGRALSQALGLPILDLDTITNPLLDGLTRGAAGAPRLLADAHWNDPALRAAVRPARYAALLAVLADQRDAGVGAVLVAPFTAELQGGTEWEALVEAAGVAPRVVWLHANPTTLAARRAERSADRDAHIVDPPADSAPAVPHLVVEAALSTTQQLATVKRALGLGRTLEATAPIFGQVFEAGLFDLDGTLIDSTPAVNRSWAQLAREYGLEVDLLAEGHGQPAAQVLAATFPPEEVAGALARIIEIEAAETADVIALPGASEALAALDDTAKAIVTSGTRLIAGNRIAAAGLTPPAAVVTFDDVTKGKPHPEPFLLGRTRLGMDHRNCVAFEDAPAGLAAARAAGCWTVGIAGTHEAHELDADLVIDGLFQLRLTPVEGGGFRLVPADLG